MHEDGFDTLVAGVRCRDVLDDLSDYLDGLLPADRVAALQAHLAGCDRCARFGSEVAGLLTALRAGAAEPQALAPHTAERLHARLATLTRE